MKRSCVTLSSVFGLWHRRRAGIRGQPKITMGAPKC